jgi:hypothetical protein
MEWALQHVIQISEEASHIGSVPRPSPRVGTTRAFIVVSHGTLSRVYNETLFLCVCVRARARALIYELCCFYFVFLYEFHSCFLLS